MAIAEGIPRSPSSPAEADGAGKPAQASAGETLALSRSASPQVAAGSTAIAPPSGAHHPAPGAQAAHAGMPGRDHATTGLLAPPLHRPAAGRRGA